MNHYHHRLLRVIIGFFTAMASGVLLTWSYYREPLLNLFPSWTTSDLSLIFSVHNITVSVVMAVSGFIVSRISSRKIYTIAAVLFLVGLGGFYFLPADRPEAAYIIAFILYAFLAPAGCALSCLLNYSVFPAWYPERSGLVSGLMVTAFNTSALVCGAIAGALIPGFGIRTALLATGIIVCAATLISVPLGVLPRADQKLPPPPLREENQNERDYTTREMLKTPSYWTVFVFHTLIFSVGLILADHAAGIARYFGAAALFGLLFAPAKGISCLVIGWIMDRKSTVAAMLFIDVVVMGSAGLLIFAASASSMILILVGLIILGFGIGGATTIKTAAIRFLFGSRNFQQNFGITNINIVLSSAVVFLASKIIEATGGTYNGVFILILCLAVLALLCTAALHFLIKREDRTTV